MEKTPNVKMGYVLALLVVLLLVGLPIAVWLDLSNLVETNLRRQASDVNSIISVSSPWPLGYFKRRRLSPISRSGSDKLPSVGD
jgi:hypothetical protein